MVQTLTYPLIADRPQAVLQRTTQLLQVTQRRCTSSIRSANPHAATQHAENTQSQTMQDITLLSLLCLPRTLPASTCLCLSLTLFTTSLSVTLTTAIVAVCVHSVHRQLPAVHSGSSTRSVHCQRGRIPSSTRRSASRPAGGSPVYSPTGSQHNYSTQRRRSPPSSLLTPPYLPAQLTIPPCWCYLLCNDVSSAAAFSAFSSAAACCLSVSIHKYWAH